MKLVLPETYSDKVNHIWTERTDKSMHAPYMLIYETQSVIKNVTTHVLMTDRGGNYEIRETRENRNANCI